MAEISMIQYHWSFPDILIWLFCWPYDIKRLNESPKQSHVIIFLWYFRFQQDFNRLSPLANNKTLILKVAGYNWMVAIKKIEEYSGKRQNIRIRKWWKVARKQLHIIWSCFPAQSPMNQLLLLWTCKDLDSLIQTWTIWNSLSSYYPMHTQMASDNYLFLTSHGFLNPSGIL